MDQNELNVLLNIFNYIIRLFDVYVDISCLSFAPVLRSLYASYPKKQ